MVFVAVYILNGFVSKKILSLEKNERCNNKKTMEQ